MSEATGFLKAAGDLVPGGDPVRWRALYDTLGLWIRAGRLDLLEEVWPQLQGPLRQTLASQAWRGRMFCGVAGAQAVLDGSQVVPSRPDKGLNQLLGLLPWQDLRTQRPCNRDAIQQVWLAGLVPHL